MFTGQGKKWIGPLFLYAKFRGVVLRANLRGASRNIITPPMRGEPLPHCIGTFELPQAPEFGNRY